MAGETKWTPGPWKASETEPRGDYCVHAQGIPWQLAYLSASAQVDWPLKANAALIAAAPDLYEALEWAVAEASGETTYTEPGQRDRCFARALAALAKARGEPPPTTAEERG